MSTSRLFSIVVALALVVVAVLTIRAGIATSEVVSSTNAALDQHERHPDFVNLSSALAEQARIEYRRGEWNASTAVSAGVALDQHERHPGFVNLSSALAEQARLEYRRGEWNAGGNADTARWVALGQFYTKLEEERLQRSQQAETARWQALGEFYARLQTKP